MSDNARYLGDGVYADLINGAIKIYVDNGIIESNIIYLDENACENLVAYIKKFSETTYGARIE